MTADSSVRRNPEIWGTDILNGQENAEPFKFQAQTPNETKYERLEKLKQVIMD